MAKRLEQFTNEQIAILLKNPNVADATTNTIKFIPKHKIKTYIQIYRWKSVYFYTKNEQQSKHKTGIIKGVKTASTPSNEKTLQLVQN